MAVNNPYAKYKQSSVETKSAGELTLMLYEGCLKFIKRAEIAIIEKNIEDKNTNLIKAQNIIRELMVTLNSDVAVSENMMQMYDFIMSQLVDANVANDLEALKQAEKFVGEFRDTWKEVIKLDRQERYGNTLVEKQKPDLAAVSKSSSKQESKTGQPLAKITPEKKLVERSQLNLNNEVESNQPAKIADSSVDKSTSKVNRVNESASPLATSTASAKNRERSVATNPYATATKKSIAANPNNPYAAAKRAAAMAGSVNRTFGR